MSFSGNTTSIQEGSPPGHLVQHPPIHSNHLAIDISILGQKQARLRHLLVATRPRCRHRVRLALDLVLVQLRLLPVVALPRRHLARKVPRRDRVDAHARLFKFGAHQPREVHRRALGGVVGKVALRVPHDAAHGADDDDAAGLVGLAARHGLQQGEEGQRGKVDGGYVGVEDGAPGFGVLLGPELVTELGGVAGRGLGFGARDAGVADEEVEAGLLGREFFIELGEVGFGGYVARTDAVFVRVVTTEEMAGMSYGMIFPGPLEGECEDAAFSRTFMRRPVMYTLAPVGGRGQQRPFWDVWENQPFAANAWAHINPMPVPPPVTRQTQPSTEKRRLLWSSGVSTFCAIFSDLLFLK